jgi:hypothetical protein
MPQNVTYSPLTNISGNSGMTIQPDVATFAGDPAVSVSRYLGNVAMC